MYISEQKDSKVKFGRKMNEAVKGIVLEGGE